MVQQNRAWRDSAHLSEASLLPPPAPAQGPEASASLLLSPTRLSPDLHETRRYSLPQVMVPFSPFSFHPNAATPEFLSRSPDLKSAPLISHTALHLFFLGSICDNYPFICLISTFPTRMRVLRE